MCPHAYSYTRHVTVRRSITDDSRPSGSLLTCVSVTVCIIPNFIDFIMSVLVLLAAPLEEVDEHARVARDDGGEPLARGAAGVSRGPGPAGDASGPAPPRCGSRAPASALEYLPSAETRSRLSTFPPSSVEFTSCSVV